MQFSDIAQSLSGLLKRLKSIPTSPASFPPLGILLTCVSSVFEILALNYKLCLISIPLLSIFLIIIITLTILFAVELETEIEKSSMSSVSSSHEFDRLPVLEDENDIIVELETAKSLRIDDALSESKKIQETYEQKPKLVRQTTVKLLCF